MFTKQDVSHFDSPLHRYVQNRAVCGNRTAKVTFDVDGVEQTLYATRSGDNYVLHFTDATSGHASYGSGRNVRIPADQAGAVSIDFNYATLLPCSFSRAWNCPIPPLENRLRVPIEAGERFAVDHDGVPLL